MKYSNNSVVSVEFFGICAVLLLVVIAYLPVSQCDWVYLDEGRAIKQNSVLKQGYTSESVAWALTTDYPDYWHPLPWLTHIGDFVLYGDDPGGHHLTNLLFHLLNVVLLFSFLRGYTGKTWPSMGVAALIGVHPIHVESVAWIFERKDLLSMTFFLAALISWRSYALEKKWVGYVGALLCLALSLTAKPMAVTFPGVLLLLDFWPLNRIKGRRTLRDFVPLAVEKIPFFAVGVAYSAFIYFHVSTVHGLVSWPPAVRIANALTSFWKYAFKLVFPRDFAVFYPHPGMASLFVAIIASLGLVALFAAAVRLRKKTPFVLWGLGWFCMTVLPVSGIAQTGSQAMADRFVYIPAIGFYSAVAFAIGTIISHRPRPIRHTTAILSISVVITLTILTNRQVHNWRNTRSLFEHSLAVAPGSALLHNNLGSYIFDQANREPSHIAEAKGHFRKAIEITPAYELAWANYGRMLFHQDSLGKSREVYEYALLLDSCCAPALQGLGLIAEREGKSDQSIQYHQQAVECEPGMWLSQYHIARMYLERGEYPAAREACWKSIRLNPYWAGYDILGRTFMRERVLDSALYYFSVASQHSQDAWEPYHNSGLVYAALGKHPQAILCFENALEKGGDAEKSVHYCLGLSLHEHGNPGRAKRHLRAALRLAPEFEAAREALNRILEEPAQGTLDSTDAG